MTVAAPLRVAVLAHMRHPIAPPFGGGMEAHAWQLVEGLVARGHDVTLFAAGDSRTSARLHAVIPRGYEADLPWAEFRDSPSLRGYLDRSMAEALEAVAKGRFDVVHNNTLHRYPPRWSRRDRAPMLTSLHVPPFDPLDRAIRESAAPWARVSACSARHLSLWWPANPPPSASVVSNGIDLAAWPFVPEGDGSAAWAGRITPNKGTHLAARSAARAGMPLTIYGVIEDPSYFAAEVAPLLRGEIRYAGHLGPTALARALGRASVLLFTPLWEEPFGLAAAEAMALGLPVAAIDNGAAREVIGPAGAFASASPESLARAMKRALAIPRAAARARAEALFGHDRMLEGYEALYREAIASREAPATPPDFPEIELPRMLATG